VAPLVADEPVVGMEVAPDMGMQQNPDADAL